VANHPPLLGQSLSGRDVSVLASIEAETVDTAVASRKKSCSR